MKSKYFPNMRADCRNVIGKHALVQMGNEIVGAQVIDRVAGKNLAKRVRVETGEHSGETLVRGQYQLIEFCEHSEMAGLLGLVWQE